MLLKPYPWKDVNYTNFETSLPVVTKLSTSLKQMLWEEVYFLKVDEKLRFFCWLLAFSMVVISEDLLQFNIFSGNSKTIFSEQSGT